MFQRPSFQSTIASHTTSATTLAATSSPVASDSSSKPTAAAIAGQHGTAFHGQHANAQQLLYVAAPLVGGNDASLSATAATSVHATPTAATSSASAPPPTTSQLSATTAAAGSTSIIARTPSTFTTTIRISRFKVTKIREDGQTEDPLTTIDTFDGDFRATTASSLPCSPVHNALNSHSSPNHSTTSTSSMHETGSTTNSLRTNPRKQHFVKHRRSSTARHHQYQEYKV